MENGDLEEVLDAESGASLGGGLGTAVDDITVPGGIIISNEKAPVVYKQNILVFIACHFIQTIYFIMFVQDV